MIEVEKSLHTHSTKLELDPSQNLKSRDSPVHIQSSSSSSPKTTKSHKKSHVTSPVLLRSSSYAVIKTNEIKLSALTDVDSEKKTIIRLNDPPKGFNNRGPKFRFFANDGMESRKSNCTVIKQLIGTFQAQRASLKTPSKPLQTFARSKSNPKINSKPNDFMSPQNNQKPSFQARNKIWNLENKEYSMKSSHINFNNDHVNSRAGSANTVKAYYTESIKRMDFFREYSPNDHASNELANMRQKSYEGSRENSPNRVNRKLSKRPVQAAFPTENESFKLRFRTSNQNTDRKIENSETIMLKDSDTNESNSYSPGLRQSGKLLLTLQSFEDKVRSYVTEKSKSSKISILLNLNEKSNENRDNSPLLKRNYSSRSLSHRESSNRNIYLSNQEPLSSSRFKSTTNMERDNGLNQVINPEKVPQNDDNQNLKVEDILYSSRNRSNKDPNDSEKSVIQKGVLEKETSTSFEVQNEANRATDLKELIRYSKQKSRNIEDYILKDGRDRAQFGGEDRFAPSFAIAQVINLRGGSAYKGLRNGNEKNNFFKDEIAEIKEVKHKIEHFKETVLTPLNLAKFQTPIEEEDVIDFTSKLTNDEIAFLKSQFEHNDFENFQFDKVDRILIRLKFFVNLDKELRALFYRHAHYLKSSQGIYLFHQGDSGDLMYVILRGGVNVKVKKHFYDGQTQDMTVASLYDGSHFGELTIINAKFQNQRSTKLDLKLSTLNEAREKLRREEQEKLNQHKFSAISVKSNAPGANTMNSNNYSNSSNQSKRSASIQCAEETHFLAIHREQFNKILYSTVKEDLDTKIRMVQSLPFFKDEEALGLLPIVNNLKAKKFKCDQKVIEMGDTIMDFLILVKGKCKVVYEFTDEDAYDVSVGSSVSQLQLAESKILERKNSRVDKSNLILQNGRNSASPLKRRISTQSSFQDNDKSPKKKLVKHSILFKTLASGDHFGYRPLLNPYADEKYAENDMSKARLSIIADSPEVELLAFSRSHLPLIPEPLKNTFLDGITKLKDYDDYDIEAYIKEYKDQKRHQKGLLQNIYLKTQK